MTSVVGSNKLTILPSARVSTSRVVGQARRFAKEIAEGIKRASDLMGQLALNALRQEIDEMVPRVRQVMKQTRARIYRGGTVSLRKLNCRVRPPTAGGLHRSRTWRNCGRD
jgi:hypothetical protein